MKTTTTAVPTLALTLALISATPLGATIFHMPYYDVEVGDLQTYTNTDWVSFKGDPQDTQGFKDTVLSFEIRYTALPGYILTDIAGGASIGNWAGATGDWASRIVMNLNGRVFDSGTYKNTVYWQQGNIDYQTPVINLGPTTSAYFRIDYYMNNYGTGESRANPFTTWVHAERGFLVNLPDTSATASLLATTLAALCALRRRFTRD